MSVSAFIKENRVLVAGLVLPALLVGVLAVAKTLPASMIDPPVQKVVYYSQGWSPKGQIALNVSEGGHLSATFNATKDYKLNNADTAPKTIAYIYDPKTNVIENVDITLDKDDQPILPDKLVSAKLSSQLSSADGYVFESYHYRNHSLITEIFAYRSYNNGPVLSKGGRIIKLPQPTVSYGSTTFLGWVEDGATK